MKPTLKVTSEGATLKIDSMLDRGRAMQSFLNRNIYRIYQNAQRDRWETENSSQSGNGQRWEPLNRDYAIRKRKIYQNYEGGGTKMLVATGKLYKSVIGPGQGQRKVVTNDKLYIATSIGYGQYVDEARSFTTWSPAFRKKVMKAVTDFIRFNIKGGVD